MVAALDETDHEHLDDVLAHLLDELDDGRSARPPERSDDDAVADLLDALTPPVLPPPTSTGGTTPTLPAPSDSLNDRRPRHRRRSTASGADFGGAGARRWMFPQLLLPAVAVVAVLALVLAVVG